MSLSPNEQAIDNGKKEIFHKVPFLKTPEFGKE